MYPSKHIHQSTALKIIQRKFPAKSCPKRQQYPKLSANYPNFCRIKSSAFPQTANTARNISLTRITLKVIHAKSEPITSLWSAASTMTTPPSLTPNALNVASSWPVTSTISSCSLMMTTRKFIPLLKRTISELWPIKGLNTSFTHS